MDYTNIQNNTLLIIPNNIKEHVLKELNKTNSLINLKIMSLDELVKKYTFDYDNNTIMYLVKKYNIKVDIAVKYIKNMYYLEDKIYKSNKLNDLNKMKKELIDNHLLIVDNLFKLLLKQKHIVIYGYDYINKYTSNIINEISSITDVKIINKKTNINNDLKAYEFNNIDEEIEYIASNIIDLLNNGVDINKIKLANITDEYIYPLNTIFKFYNIPLILNNSTSLYETNIGNKFINYLKDSDFNNALEKLKEEVNLNLEENLNIYNKLIDISNTFDVDKIDECVYKCIIYTMKNTKLKPKKLENAVEIIDIKDNIIPDDLYVFILGFNQGNIPIIYKDEDYISDNLKDEVNIETTLEKNINEKNIVSNIIKSIKNLVITYKLKTPFDTYYPSGLINDLNIDVIKNINIKNTYSNTYNKIKLAKKLDKLVKFNEVDNDLDILYNTYKNIDYLTYDNKFSGIDKNELIDYLDNKLLLSYSSIDKFYRCKFRYYINNILKLEKYEETFPIFIGNLFHYILSICFNTDFDFENEWNNYLKDKELSNKDKYFLNKLKDELLFIIDTIKEQENFSKLNNKLYEEKIYINKNKNIKITFMGIVDKIQYEEKDGQTIVAIIDYKTGNPETNLNNTIYGIEMQLPVYLYLVKNSNKFNNVKFSGFYLQKILNNETTIKKGDDINQVKKSNLKLQGYSNSNEEILKEFDFSYKDSEVIKSMKMSNKGFYSYAKVIDDEKINKLTHIVDKNIDNAINDIMEADFKINPKRIGLKNLGCEYCKFKDLCFKTEKDIVNLKEYKNLEFLEGDINA